MSRSCWQNFVGFVNHETNHQLRDKTISCNVIAVLCAWCHHKLNECLYQNYIDNRYTFCLPFPPSLVLLQCVIKPAPGRFKHLQCGNMYRCDNLFGHNKRFLGFNVNLRLWLRHAPQNRSLSLLYVAHSICSCFRKKAAVAVIK